MWFQDSYLHPWAALQETTEKSDGLELSSYHADLFRSHLQIHYGFFGYAIWGTALSLKNYDQTRMLLWLWISKMPAKSSGNMQKLGYLL